MRDTEPYKTGYDEGFAKGFNKAVELANAVELNGEQRLLLAMDLKKLLIEYIKEQGEGRK